MPKVVGIQWGNPKENYALSPHIFPNHVGVIIYPLIFLHRWLILSLPPAQERGYIFIYTKPLPRQFHIFTLPTTTTIYI